MNVPPSTQLELEAHAAVGRAVIACQLLEMLFALCVRLVFKHRSATTLADITPLEKNFSKPSTKFLLNELGKYVEVNAEFEAKVRDLIDRRHLLIHRWGIEHDLPANDEGLTKIATFSRVLEIDAVGLATVLYKYVVEWEAQFPELRASLNASEKTTLLKIPEELKFLSIERADP